MSIISEENRAVEAMATRAQKVGYAFVVCDLFHVGHLKFLRAAKEYCDYLIVGVLTDEAVRAYKRKPVIPLNERVEIVRALRCVNKVVIQNGRDPTETMKKLVEEGRTLSFLFHGDDWAVIPGTEYIESMGGQLIKLTYYQPTTTTKIIAKIRSLKLWSSLGKYSGGF